MATEHLFLMELSKRSDCNQWGAYSESSFSIVFVIRTFYLFDSIKTKILLFTSELLHFVSCAVSCLLQVHFSYIFLQNISNFCKQSTCSLLLYPNMYQTWMLNTVCLSDALSRLIRRTYHNERSGDTSKSEEKKRADKSRAMARTQYLIIPYFF